MQSDEAKDDEDATEEPRKKTYLKPRARLTRQSASSPHKFSGITHTMMMTNQANRQTLSYRNRFGMLDL